METDWIEEKELEYYCKGEEFIFINENCPYMDKINKLIKIKEDYLKGI